MPDFLKVKRPLFLGAGDIIQVPQDVDLQRVGQSKSKKAKGVYELMRTFKTGKLAETYSSNTNMIG